MRLRHVMGRAVSTVFVVFGIFVITFFLTHLIPADPARVAAGPRATPEQVAAVRSQLGLDQPLLRQFGNFVSQLAHAVSYTHLRAHETDSYLVCRLLLE